MYPKFQFFPLPQNLPGSVRNSLSQQIPPALSLSELCLLSWASPVSSGVTLARLLAQVWQLSADSCSVYTLWHSEGSLTVPCQGEISPSGVQWPHTSLHGPCPGAHPGAHGQSQPCAPHSRRISQSIFNLEEHCLLWKPPPFYTWLLPLEPHQM